MNHPLRFIIPPLVVLIALTVYIPLRQHEIALRKNPHHHPHPPYSHTVARGVVAAGLIVAFIAAFILP